MLCVHSIIGVYGDVALVMGSGDEDVRHEEPHVQVL